MIVLLSRTITARAIKYTADVIYRRRVHVSQSAVSRAIWLAFLIRRITETRLGDGLFRFAFRSRISYISLMLRGDIILTRERRNVRYGRRVRDERSDVINIFIINSTAFPKFRNGFVVFRCMYRHFRSTLG